MKKREYTIKLDKDDLYWIQTLLGDKIDGDSNIHQKLLLMTTLSKTLKPGNFHMYLEKKDIYLLSKLSSPNK